ncbi:hypothetical protein [Streptomyces luteolus]|uniref:Uncharacterized protein n=1 Tax=Streptomyces luteolus TaxID=3043615 RepID=A0ABT6T5I8_9ACTN|nr:hypothetical protein [Streptomyces sp. B-S-A12]MDI3423137.1 hypothetical protein [Streptomyces sp. B-S-A12]
MTAGVDGAATAVTTGGMARPPPDDGRDGAATAVTAGVYGAATAQ